MIPQSFIHDLTSRADIVAVVGRSVELKKAGINYKGLCPFHGEKTPSFIVSPSRQTYHCFGCGVHGNALGFLMEHHGLSFVEAVKDLAQSMGVAVPEEPRTAEEQAREAAQRHQQATLGDVLTRAATHWRKQLKASPRAIEYLKGRGLTGPVAARFGLGYAPPGWHGLASAFEHYDDPSLVDAGLVIAPGSDDPDTEQRRYDRFRDRIMFPIRNPRGDVIGFGGRVLDGGEPKYLNSPETPVFVKGRELYGLFEARQAIRERGYVLVTEGYMDVVALAQLGFPNAVATLGTACTAEHIQKLVRYTDRVVFSFDGDAAGQRAAARALEAVLPQATDTRGFRFLFLPAEHDPDSFIRAEGAEAFEQRVEQALTLSAQLMRLVQEDRDMATPEGRAGMLAAAQPLWSLLPEGLLREQLMVQLALAGEISTDVLSRHWLRQPVHRDSPSAQDRRSPVSRPGGPSERPRFATTADAGRRPPPRATNLLDRAGWLLLHHVDLWTELSEHRHELLCRQPPPYGELFSAIERAMHDEGPLPAEGLLATLPSLVSDDAALHALLHRLEGLHDVEAGTTAVRQELETLLERLHLQNVEDEIGLLLESGDLSESAQRRRNELFQLRARLKGAGQRPASP